MNRTGQIHLFFCFGTIAIICALPGALSCADIPANAFVGAWLFDEGQGDTVSDASGNGNHATIADGHPEWVEGKLGMAMEFDGEVDYLVAPDSPSFNSINEAVSIVAWVKPMGISGLSSYIISRPLVYTLEIQNERFRPYICVQGKPDHAWGCRGNGVTEIKAGEWVHLALVYDGKELRGYVNGKIDSTCLIPEEGNIIALTGELRIGGDPAGLSDPRDPRMPRYFIGSIDEVGLFKAALTEDEIREIMGMGLTGLAVEPKAKLATTWGAVKQ